MIFFLIIFLIILSTTLGGLFAIKFKDKLHLILGFGAGAIFGVALFDLLPESIELTKNIYNISITALFIAIGFSIYMLLDRFLSSHKHCDEICNNDYHNDKLGVLSIILHSFLDGFGIGIAFKISPAVGWVVATAIMIHSFSDGINTVNMITKNKGDRKSAIKWLIIDALSPIIGIITAFLLFIPDYILGSILSIFVGLFLYLSTSSLIPESHHRHPKIWTTISTIIGILVIFLITYFSVNI